MHPHNDTAMDPCCLLFILLLIKLSGTLDVTTVSKISVQRGQSILIPCSYNQSNDFLGAGCYTELSYLRYNPIFSDDETHKIFTVCMDNVQKSGECWCSVRPSHGPEKRTKFRLEVTSGPSRLYVSSQNLIVSEKNSVAVTCYHHGQSDVKWCKFGGRCMRKTSGTLDRASVEIRYYPTCMTVTMNKLKKKNTGWYWCSSSDLQIPVHITVKQTSTELPQTTSETNRKRTAVLLPVLLGILLVIITYAAWRVFKLCRERREAEDTHYVTMHRKWSSHQTSSADVSEGIYERMAGLKSNIEEPEYVNVTKT